MNLGRRKIIKLAFALAGGAILPKLPASAVQPRPNGKSIKISLIPGVNYPESFLKFAERARFSHPRDAIASVRDRRLAYDLVWEQ
jgi:hypothetical protein